MHNTNVTVFPNALNNLILNYISFTRVLFWIYVAALPGNLLIYKLRLWDIGFDNVGRPIIKTSGFNPSKVVKT